MHPPRIGLALVTCVALSACSPVATPTASPLPSMPVPTCTPEFGGEPFPCTESDLEAQQKLDARYAEAERVLRRSVELENEMYHSGTGSLAPELVALYDPEGPYAAYQVKVAEAAADYDVAGDFVVTSLERAPLDSADEPATLAVTVCIDASKTLFTSPDGSVDSGESGPMKVAFTESGAPRIWNAYALEGALC